MNPELKRLLMEHFRQTGIFPEQDVAIVFQALADTVLKMSIQTTHPTEEARCLLGFSYGGRHNVYGNIEFPGPQNEQIADAICACYSARKESWQGTDEFSLPVCVQGEVVMRSRLPAVVHCDDLNVLDNPIDWDTAKHIGYPTQKVWKDIEAVMRGNGIEITHSVVGIFAHRLHLSRIISYAQTIGVTQIASPVEQLPTDYDPRSGYAWARDTRSAIWSHWLSVIGKLRSDEYKPNPPRWFLHPEE